MSQSIQEHFVKYVILWRGDHVLYGQLFVCGSVIQTCSLIPQLSEMNQIFLFLKYAIANVWGNTTPLWVLSCLILQQSPSLDSNFDTKILPINIYFVPRSILLDQNWTNQLEHKKIIFQIIGIFHWSAANDCQKFMQFGFFILQKLQLITAQNYKYPNFQKP